MNIRLLLALLALCSALQSRAEPVVRLAYIEFPPATYTDRHGQPAGFLIELASRVLTHAGYGMDARSFPTSRMIHRMIDGSADLWLGVESMEPFRETTYIGRSTIAVLELRAFGNDVAPDLSTKEDLAGKTVALLRGYSYGDWADFIRQPGNGVSFVEVNTHEQGLKLLRARRVDLLLDYDRPVSEVLATMDYPELRSSLLSTLPIHFVVSRRSPIAVQLLEDLESSFRSLSETAETDVATPPVEGPPNGPAPPAGSMKSPA